MEDDSDMIHYVANLSIINFSVRVTTLYVLLCLLILILTLLEVTFFRTFLISQLDRVSYRGLMGGATVVHATKVHYCRSRFFSICTEWGPLSVEINRPPSRTLGALWHHCNPESRWGNDKNMDKWLQPTASWLVNQYRNQAIHKPPCQV